VNASDVQQTTGKIGERIGEDFLVKRGYQILGRNVRSPFGEIDLVANHRGTLVFVEIKARRSQTFGFAEEAIDRRKRDRLTRLASWYLACHPKIQSPVRFDVLAIQWAFGKPDVHLIENAFEL
jgi:putative endonuclease